MLHIGLISIFPEILNALKFGITGRCLEQKLAKLTCWDLRDWGLGPSCQIDDKPYGGGPGMVLMFEPLSQAITYAKSQMDAPCKTIYLSPQGKQVLQSDLNKIAAVPQSILFIAGRYEGIDERIIETFVDEEWSIGDFVLSGGELAAMVFIDGILRLLPGSLGDNNSAVQDSFMQGILDYPHYTRPANINGLQVPPVLLGGNHREIARFRRKQALGMTWLKKPALLEKANLNTTDKQLLIEFQKEHRTSPEVPYEE